MKLDMIIISGMLSCIAGAVFMVARARLIFTRIGFLISAGVACVGLAYHGWLPLFGGSHPLDTYFGSVILSLGLLGFCLFGAIEEIWRRLTVGPDAGHGFPVVPSQRFGEPK